jgi:hypothetical protein
MRKDEFQEGAEWAYRPSNAVGAPASRVSLVFQAKGRAGRVKVRHLAGELDGLEEFVSAAHLRSRWKDWSKVEKDEEREKRLIDYLAEREPLQDVVLEAAEEVLEAAREGVVIENHPRGYTRWNEEPELDRLCVRAGLADRPWRAHPCFRHRSGDWYIPDYVLVEMAMAFAAAEPETVHLHLDVEEQALLREGYWLDELEAHRRLLQSKPAFAVARSWAGGAEAHRHLRNELNRTQYLLRKAVYDLRECGSKQKARKLERAIDPGQ